MRKLILVLTSISIPPLLIWAYFEYKDLLFERQWKYVPEVPSCTGMHERCSRIMHHVPANLHQQPTIVKDPIAVKSRLTQWRVEPILQYLSWFILTGEGELTPDCMVFFDCCITRQTKYNDAILVGCIGEYLITIHDPGTERSMARGNFATRVHCPLPPKAAPTFTHTMGRKHFQSWPDHYHGYLSVPVYPNRAKIMGPGMKQDGRYSSRFSKHPMYQMIWLKEYDAYTIAALEEPRLLGPLVDSMGNEIQTTRDPACLHPLNQSQRETLTAYLTEPLNNITMEPDLVEDALYPFQGFPDTACYPLGDSWRAMQSINAWRTPPDKNRWYVSIPATAVVGAARSVSYRLQITKWLLALDDLEKSPVMISFVPTL